MKRCILNIPLSKLKVLAKDNKIAAVESGQSFRKIAENGRIIQVLDRYRNEIYSNGKLK